MLARTLWVLTLIRLVVVVLIAYGLHAGAGWPLAPSIIVAVLVPLLGHLAILGSQFLLARWSASPVPPRFAIGPAGWLRVFAEEARVSLVSFTVRQPLLGSRPVASAAAPGAADRLPVLFVHGFFCNRAVWRPMARVLARRGHVTASVNLEPVFGSIDAYVDVIERGIRDLQRRTGDEQVALVCHSMGGLAARAYLRARGIDDVARVVTIGSPHRGSVHSRFGLATNVRQMRRDSDWLAGLARTEWPSVRRLFTIVLSHHDNIVAPQAIQTLPDATTIELGAVGHMAMLERAPVHELVARLLVR
ncbi:MAG: alpha/beta fold hydrolase [Burkholderiaceae bacterium]